MTTLDQLRARCAAKPGSEETFPFDTDTLVFKVGGKMYALTSISAKPLRVNLKCQPELAELLRSEHAAIAPGWHMNKRHWNTVTLDGSLPDALVIELIDRSYELVVRGLPRAKRVHVHSVEVLVED
jgi:predicted DNA-binding protein (MmcQ/YjbR family)